MGKPRRDIYHRRLGNNIFLMLLAQRILYFGIKISDVVMAGAEKTQVLVESLNNN